LRRKSIAFCDGDIASTAILDAHEAGILSRSMRSNRSLKKTETLGLRTVSPESWQSIPAMAAPIGLRLNYSTRQKDQFSINRFIIFGIRRSRAKLHELFVTLISALVLMSPLIDRTHSEYELDICHEVSHSRVESGEQRERCTSKSRIRLCR
jgi:hypothetical protein